MTMIGCTGPPKPEKFRMYHNLVAAPAFLVTIGPCDTLLYEQYLSFNGLLLVKCQLEPYLPARTPAWTVVASLDVIKTINQYIVKVYETELIKIRP
jgi:hypothetical protein